MWPCSTPIIVYDTDIQLAQSPLAAKKCPKRPKTCFFGAFANLRPRSGDAHPICRAVLGPQVTANITSIREAGTTCSLRQGNRSKLTCRTFVCRRIGEQMNDACRRRTLMTSGLACTLSIIESVHCTPEDTQRHPAFGAINDLQHRK